MLGQPLQVQEEPSAAPERAGHRRVLVSRRQVLGGAAGLAGWAGLTGMTGLVGVLVAPAPPAAAAVPSMYGRGYRGGYR